MTPAPTHASGRSLLATAWRAVTSHGSLLIRCRSSAACAASNAMHECMPASMPVDWPATGASRSQSTLLGGRGSAAGARRVKS